LHSLIEPSDFESFDGHVWVIAAAAVLNSV
jgi:hypothetical protein